MNRKSMGALIVVLIVLSSSVAAVVLFRNGAESGDIPSPEDNIARAWVDLTSVSSGPLREDDRWGNVETFSGAATGTLNYFRQVSLIQSSASESVVLDGRVWCMVRSNVTDQVLLRYTPQIMGDRWNISLECYAPQAGDLFDPSFGPQKIGLTATLVDRLGEALMAVELAYGSPGNNFVHLTDVGSGAVETLSERMLPSTVAKDASEGSVPDRYIVSFQSSEGGDCVVTVLHTSGVRVGQGVVAMPEGWSPAQLVLSSNSTVLTRYGVDPSVPMSATVYTGAWVVDNLACRGATARYPLAGPSYEYCVEGAEGPGYNASRSSEQAGAVVTIDGKEAAYNSTSGRYEASLDLRSRWGMPVNYSVELDGVTLNDTISLTMISSAEHASVSRWWNGWDWASVFGEDDSTGPADIMNVYAGYQHPLTAYVMSAMADEHTSDKILTAPYVEIALHNPHDWEGGAKKFWLSAVADANSGMNHLKSFYEFASRWDAPANGGKGDTYISMANPGNKASYQMMYALYLAGIRIDGRSSDLAAGSAGNHSQIGSWYDVGGYHGTGGGWHPYQAMDLMDAARALSWDNPQSWSSTFALVNGIAENNGVLRVYGHPGRNIAIPEVLHWIDNEKTNYTLENWKATDGEVASYIFGRWSTEVQFDPARSGTDTWTYSVSRQDARTAGYWNVPVTIEIDLQGRTVKDVEIREGGKTVAKAQGTLKDLDAGRIMDTGYDVRGGKLYVSYIWSANSQLTITFDGGARSSFHLVSSEPLDIMRTEGAYIFGRTSER